MKFSLKSILALGLGVITTAAMCPSASAYTLGAWAGKPHSPSQASLFAENWGGITQIAGAGTSVMWDLPIPLTYNGNLDVTVYVNTKPSLGGTNCSLQSGNSYGGGAGTAWSSIPPSELGWNDVTFSIGTTGGANAELRCAVHGGDQLEGISY